MNAEKFMKVAHRHTSFEELTPTLLREFVEKIVVHEYYKDGNGKIFYTSFTSLSHISKILLLIPLPLLSSNRQYIVTAAFSDIPSQRAS